jgi:hypothetical protein
MLDIEPTQATQQLVHLDRKIIVQSILDAFSRKTYLEIGVNTGNSFIPIKAHRKWGVDPCYLLTRRRRMSYAVLSLLRIRSECLFRMPSDEFFTTKARLLGTHGIDVCLVDGLHTYEQALRDVLNSLSFLNPGGVILLHDCNPRTELMAISADSIEMVIRRGIPHWDGAWSGDVWKTIVHLRALRTDVSVFVLDCDTGIGVVTKREPTYTLPYSADDIRLMNYEFLSRNRNTLLDLRPPEYFHSFLQFHANADVRRPAVL